MANPADALAIMLLPVALAGAGPQQDSRDRQKVARAALREGEVVPLKRILRAASSRVPGDISKVELEIEKHRLIYEVKIVGRDGAVSKLLFDARTGAYLGLDD